jgi:hypothetical protein
MTTNIIPKSEVLFTESPVSWNTRYVTTEGFEYQLTLRGESGQEVLEKANSAIEYLLSIGCAPVANRYSSYVKPSTSTPANGNSTSTNRGNQASWCPIHNMEMKRWEKDGRVWFSHKVGDEWCSGKPKRR